LSAAIRLSSNFASNIGAPREEGEQYAIEHFLESLIYILENPLPARKNPDITPEELERLEKIALARKIYRETGNIRQAARAVNTHHIIVKEWVEDIEYVDPDIEIARKIYRETGNINKAAKAVGRSWQIVKKWVEDIEGFDPRIEKARSVYQKTGSIRQAAKATNASRKTVKKWIEDIKYVDPRIAKARKIYQKTGKLLETARTVGARFEAVKEWVEDIDYVDPRIVEARRIYHETGNLKKAAEAVNVSIPTVKRWFKEFGFGHGWTEDPRRIKPWRKNPRRLRYYRKNISDEELEIVKQQALLGDSEARLKLAEILSTDEARREFLAKDLYGWRRYQEWYRENLDALLDIDTSYGFAEGSSPPPEWIPTEPLIGWTPHKFSDKIVDILSLKQVVDLFYFAETVAYHDIPKWVSEQFFEIYPYLREAHKYRKNISDENLEHLKQKAKMGDSEAIQEMLEIGIPLYKHDCKICKYLGSIFGGRVFGREMYYDFYICKPLLTPEGRIIARHGDQFNVAHSYLQTIPMEGPGPIFSMPTFLLDYLCSHQMAAQVTSVHYFAGEPYSIEKSEIMCEAAKRFGLLTKKEPECRCSRPGQDCDAPVCFYADEGEF
jgi:transposase-like protein